MLKHYSPQAIKIIEVAEQLAKKHEANIIGTEYLLLSMFSIEDTICHFLLSEESVTEAEIIHYIEELQTETKNNNSKFSNKFQEIIKKTEEAISVFNSKYIYDEHIFYTLLLDLNTNCTKIIKSLGLNPSVLIDDILDIFNVKEINEFPFITNLSKNVLTHPYIPKKFVTLKLNTILSKKQKNNALIIGSAGIGKSALIEWFAIKNPNLNIYRFDLGSMVAGTKYRGELEDKIIKAIEFVKSKNGIVFIDEIHNIVGSGSNESSLDIANILKPYITRSNYHFIGATTLDEYYRLIYKDKALSRRFHNIFLHEPNVYETYNIIKKIKQSYEEYHHIKYSNKLIKYIINKTNKLLPNKAFPDKVIDVIDELGALINKTNKNTSLYLLVDKIINDESGIYIKHTTNLLNYPVIKNIFQDYLKTNKVLIGIINKHILDIDKLKKDLEMFTSFKSENYLEIDLESYFDNSSINQLIGSNAGYVGYDNGGILSEHLIKYPFSLIYLKNFDKACILVKNFFEKVFLNGYFLDNKSRKIYVRNVLFVKDTNKFHKNKIGFNREINKNNLIIDSYITI